MIELIQKYREIISNVRGISKFAALSMAMFALLNLFDIFRYFVVNSADLFSVLKNPLLFAAIFLQMAIVAIFGARFVFLFRWTDRAFSSEQILWFSGLFLLLFYWYISLPEPGLFGFYDTFGPSIFAYAFRRFEALAILYLIFSPLVKLIAFAVAFFRSR